MSRVLARGWDRLVLGDAGKFSGFWRVSMPFYLGWPMAILSYVEGCCMSSSTCCFKFQRNPAAIIYHLYDGNTDGVTQEDAEDSWPVSGACTVCSTISKLTQKWNQMESQCMEVMGYITSSIIATICIIWTEPAHCSRGNWEKIHGAQISSYIKIYNPWSFFPHHKICGWVYQKVCDIIIMYEQNKRARALNQDVVILFIWLVYYYTATLSTPV